MAVPRRRDRRGPGAPGLSSFPVVEFDDVLAGRVGEAEHATRFDPPGASCSAAPSTAAEAEAWNARARPATSSDNVFQERFLDEAPGCRDRLADLAGVLVATAGRGTPARPDVRSPPLPQPALVVRVRR